MPTSYQTPANICFQFSIDQSLHPEKLWKRRKKQVRSRRPSRGHTLHAVHHFLPIDRPPKVTSRHVTSKHWIDFDTKTLQYFIQTWDQSINGLYRPSWSRATACDCWCFWLLRKLWVRFPLRVIKYFAVGGVEVHHTTRNFLSIGQKIVSTIMRDKKKLKKSSATWSFNIIKNPSYNRAYDGKYHKMSIQSDFLLKRR